MRESKARGVLIFLVLLVMSSALLVTAQNPAGGYQSPSQGGGGTPGGSNGQIQYNNSGVFGGSPAWSVSGNNISSGVASAAVGNIGAGSYIAFTSAGTISINTQGGTFLTLTGGAGLQAATYTTTTNCSSSASPAVCASAAAGSVAIAAAATTEVVNTTAVTANSQIFIQEDDSLGSKLSVTCNTTSLGATKISARTAGTSFTITTAVAPTTNPACLSYLIVN